MEGSTRVFALEVTQPVIEGVAAPVLVVYVLEGRSTLALPKEVYRSKPRSSLTVNTDGMTLPVDQAWSPSDYQEVTGFDELEAAILQVLNPPTSELEDAALHLVSGIVTDVRTRLGDLPGLYL